MEYQINFGTLTQDTEFYEEVSGFTIDEAIGGVAGHELTIRQ